MAHNTCSPTDIFGGIEQTMFLGCSVLNFDMSLGWGSQVSNLTVNLVHDPCPGVKYYFDPMLSTPKQLWTGNGKDYDGNTVNKADPGFYAFGTTGVEPPEIGAPVYFRMDEFEFCGILQSFTENFSTSGHHLYTVTISDPRTILEGAEVIIGDYNGSVGNSYNLFNVFGFWEQFGGMNCPSWMQVPVDGAIFGSISGGYGGASRGTAGMLWSQIKNGISLLTSSALRVNSLGYGNFSPYGRILYRGAYYGGFGLLKHDVRNLNFGSWFGLSSYLSEYYVDLTTLPLMPSDFRLSGTSLNILDIITQVCTASAHDFYIELVPVRMGSVILKVIKVRSVSRAAQPDLNAITRFIDNVSSDTKVEYTRGRELRNEATSNFIIGGSKQSIYQVEQNYDPPNEPNDCIEAYSANSMYDDMISPYWGKNYLGNVILTNIDGNGRWEFTTDTNTINQQLSVYTLPATVTIGEMEIRSALSNLDTWMAYEESADPQTDIGTVCDIHGFLNPNPAKNNVKTNTRNIIKGNQGALPSVAQMYELKLIHEWLKSFGNFYGKKYMVRLPYTCGVWDDTGHVVTSDSPSDGGWTEASTIIGLPNTNFYMDGFRLDDNRLGILARFDDFRDEGGIDIGNLSLDKYGFIGDQLWVKARIDPEFVYVNSNTLCSPRAVIELPDGIYTKDPDFDSPKYMKGIPESIVSESQEGRPYYGLNEEQMYLGLENTPAIPDAAVIATISSVNTYGPWKTSNMAETGPPGQRAVQKDDSLVPWELGSLANLNTYAQGLANQSVSSMQVGEMGTITMVGLPDVPLGAELGAVNGLGGSSAFSNNEHLIEYRTVSSTTNGTANMTYYYVSYNIWGNIFGPNITGINVRGGIDGYKTTYQMRTFTPEFGRFSKINAERFKRQNQIIRMQQKIARMVERDIIRISVQGDFK